MTLAAPEAHLAAVCEGMARIVADNDPFPIIPERDPDPYASLIRAVVFQQLSGKAAETIYGRLVAAFPEAPFPSPATLIAAEDAQLRSVGLSRQKSAAIKDIAQKRLDGIVPPAEDLQHLSNEEIVARLTQARGVGRWTVQMHLIFAMGRQDILPLDDLGVRKGAEKLFGRAFSPKELEAFGVRWAPWRSAAAWHLWRMLDMVAP